MAHKTTQDIQDHAHEAGLKGYIAVWLALLVFTAITVATANMNFGQFGIFIVLAIASIKSLLVIYIFMHMLYEKFFLLKLLIPITVVLLAIFIGITNLDILSR